MTTRSVDATALAGIRLLASLTVNGVAKTPLELRQSLLAIKPLTDDALATPGPAVPTTTTVVQPPPVLTPITVPPTGATPSQPPVPAPQPSATPAFVEPQPTDEAAMGARLAKYPGTVQRGHLIHADTTQLYRGRPTIRYDQPGGTADSPELWPKLPQPLDDVWLRAMVLFSRTWWGRAYKLLALGWESDPSVAISQRATVEVVGTGYQLRGAVSAGGRSVVPFVWTPAGALETDEWEEHLLHYVVKSPTTATLEYWRTTDGTIRGNPYAIALTGAVRRVSFVCWGLNFNDIRSNAQEVWWSDCSVHAGGNPWNV